MTNMPAATEARTLRSRHPMASIGLHWNLTVGTPVLPHSHVQSLVDASGRFWTFREFRKRWLLGRLRPEHIRSELRAQHEQFLALARDPDYWNTHQNIHVFPVLFRIFVEMGQQLEIPAMRCHRRVTVPLRCSPGRYNMRHPLYWLKGQIIAEWSRAAERKGMRMPAGTLAMPGATAGKRELEQVVQLARFKRLRTAAELVVHPATAAEGEHFGSMTRSRLIEYQVFRDPNLVHRLAGLGVTARGFEVV